jgi:hypothetical protein
MGTTLMVNEIFEEINNGGIIVKFSSFSYLAIVGLSLTALAGCSTATPAPQAAPATTVFVTQTPEAPIETAVPPQEVVPTQEPQPAAVKVKVPNGVGKDYQTAQDLWRAAGLIVAPATDALGANRIPIIDANWVVLSQIPKAGTTVQSGSTITATVKKFTDD